MHIAFTLTLLGLMLIVTAVLAIIDAVARLRGRRGIGVLAIIELIAAILLLLSLFITLPHALGNEIMEIVLEIVLILLLIFRGSVRRGFAAITVVALILNTILLFTTLGWLHIPWLNTVLFSVNS
ncbi:MAG TPA: hypothetical protein VGI56_00940 [Galbitalea sp.]|jgi:uncharacterized membrane protein